MKQELEQKIQKILASNFETPSIFKTVLKKELALTEKEEILDLVNIQREYADAVKKTQIYAPAVLLIATTYGLIAVEEGQTALELDYGGYRIRHIMYSKIRGHATTLSTNDLMWRQYPTGYYAARRTTSPRLIATPARACETGHAALTSAAICSKRSWSMPGTTAETSRTIEVMPLPGSKVTAAEASIALASRERPPRVWDIAMQ